MNLVMNAKDAMPAGGEIKVRPTGERPVADGSSSDCNTILTVSDTGMGVDLEFQKEIFNPFFTTKGQLKGIGLGLYIVNYIVKQHRGAVAVSSQPGKGTTFILRFPAADLSDTERLA